MYQHCIDEIRNKMETRLTENDDDWIRFSLSFNQNFAPMFIARLLDLS